MLVTTLAGQVIVGGWVPFTVTVKENVGPTAEVQVAVIAKRPQGYFITHVEGANFPAVNGKMLDAQAHLLNDHDIIELAGVKMEFFFKT